MNQKPQKTIEQLIGEFEQMIMGFGRGKQAKNGSGGSGGNDGFSSSGNSRGFRSQIFVVAAIAVAYGFFTSFYKIDETQEGVITRFGAFSHIAGPGPHFKLPFGIDQVYKVEVTRFHELQFGFRKDEQLSERQARQESLVLTGDLNVAVVEWILNYKIQDPKKYLFHAVNVEKNIRDISISVMRRVVGDKLVSDVLTTDRVSIADRARELTQQALDVYDMGILVTKVALQSVTPPEPVKPAFNEVNIARQEKERMINDARGVYNKVIPEAEGKSEKVVAEAEAYAVDRVNRAKGDALKYSEMLAAYKESPQITRKRIYLETMAEIFAGKSKITVVDAQIKGLLPIFSQKSDLKESVEEHTVSESDKNRPVITKK